MCCALLKKNVRHEWNQQGGIIKLGIVLPCAKFVLLCCGVLLYFVKLCDGECVVSCRVLFVSYCVVALLR